MRITTYIGYVSLGAFLCAAMPSSARPQTTSTNPASASQSAATEGSSDWQNWGSHRAQWQKEMKRYQQVMRAESAKLQAELQMARNSEWAQEVRNMAEARRQMGQELRANSEVLRAEAAKEMGANGWMNRAQFDQLRSQLQAAELATRAQDEARQAVQLFSQSPNVLQFMDDTGWLGIEVSEVNSDQAKELKLPETRGVLVSNVVGDSPAAKAGLKDKDVIMEYDGTPVEGTVQFRRLVRETPPGRTVNLTVVRDGQETKLSVQVGDGAQSVENTLRFVSPSSPRSFNFTMPEVEVFGTRTPVLGIQAEDLSGQLGGYFHVPGGEGVLIREVSEDTPAAKAGLKAGDVITKIDGNAVKSLSGLRESLRQKRDEKSVTLTVIREGAEKSVNVSIEPPPAQHRTVIRSAAM